MIKYKTILSYVETDFLISKKFKRKVLAESNSLTKLHFICENPSFVQFRQLINILYQPRKISILNINYILDIVNEILTINSDIKDFLIHTLEDFLPYEDNLYYFQFSKTNHEIELIMIKSVEGAKVTGIKITNLSYLNLDKY